MLSKNPHGDYPQIDSSVYVHGTAEIIGNVKIGKNVFIGPSAVLRADEPGSSITIDDNSNVQDRVIIHALSNSSVFIGKNVSLAHGCIIHGPCKIGRDCFVGFGSVLFNSVLGNGVFVKHISCVEDITISSNKLVGSNLLINEKLKERALEEKAYDLKVFAKKVVKVNLDLVKGYKSTE